MKTVYFNRHAKSDWSNRNLSDFDRPLNKRGLRDAPEMGKRLKKRGEPIALFISSPAKRAYSTACIMAENFGYPIDDIRRVDRLYLPSVSDFIQTLSEVENSHDSVIVFAHNPGITEVVEYLGNEGVGNMPTCGLAKIKFPLAESWREISGGTGNLEIFDYPKKDLA